jgi:hypothetical protein
MHPDGVVAGVDSMSAGEEFDAGHDGIETIVRRSSQQSSIERLQIYSNAYVARLVECLREEFPILAATLGHETFDSFAVAYLRRHPSRSFTLANLGRDFASYLYETRPGGVVAGGESEDAMSDWFDFLIDLARFERACSEVFDGPGIERGTSRGLKVLSAIPSEQWCDVRFLMNPSLRVLTLDFPIHDTVASARHSQPTPLPARSPTYLVLHRHHFVVRHVPVTFEESEILSALMAGLTLQESLQILNGDSERLTDRFVEQLREWFYSWTRLDFIIGVDDTDVPHGRSGDCRASDRWSARADGP